MLSIELCQPYAKDKTEDFAVEMREICFNFLEMVRSFKQVEGFRLGIEAESTFISLTASDNEFGFAMELVDH